jgi:serine/threonine protein phosphatase PrpC
VLDGHGGKDAAIMSRRILKGHLVPLMQSGSLDSNTVKERLARVFLDTDEQLRSQLQNGSRIGTTCALALLTQTESRYCIHLAHVGDTRVLVCAAGKLVVTEDHKPGRADETIRVCQAGGTVDPGPYKEGPLRIDGALAVSRAFGDFIYKSINPPGVGKVIPTPDVQTVFADPGDWILLACDGIFDVFSNAEVYGFLKARLSSTEVVDGGLILQELLNASLERGSKDNCTAMLIQLQRDCIVKTLKRTMIAGGYQSARNGEVLQKYREFMNMSSVGQP